MSSAAFLAQVLLGFEKAFADFAEEIEASGAPLALLDDLGWTTAPGTSLTAVEGKFSALSTALQGLAGSAQTLSQVDPDADVTEVLLAIAGVATDVGLTVNAARELEQVQGAGGLPAPFSDPALWTSLAKEATDLLVIRYLDRHQRPVIGVLRVLGVVAEMPHDAVGARGAYVEKKFDWAALASAVSAPGDIMSDVYGWGGTFNADLLLRNLAALFSGFGLFPARYRPQGPLLNLYYGSGNPLRETVTQLSLPLYWQRSTADPTSEVLEVDLQLGLLPIPPAGNLSATAKAEGLVLFPSLQTAAAATFPISGNTDLTVAGAFEAALVRLDIHPDSAGLSIDPLAAQFAASALVEAKPPEPWILLGTKGSSRVELDGAHAKLGVQSTTTDLEAKIEGGLDDARVVIQFDESDGFLRKIFGTKPQEIPFSVAALWSSKSGFRFEGHVALEVALPLHLSIGGVINIETLYVSLGAGSTGAVRLVVATAAGVKLGPLAASVDRTGISLDLVPTPAPKPPGNLGSLDLRFGFKPPDGAGLSIKAGPVTGGGYISFDPENEQYAGILQLSFKTISITAIALLTTRLPDASGPPGATKKGFSLLVIIAVELPPIALGYGFTLNGVGGLLGINRSMEIKPLRDGVRDGSVNAILFPKDPVARATQIISQLRSIFPPAEGRFVFGPMVKIGWGPNSIIELEAALVLELMAPIKLVILGRIQAALPDKKDAVLKLRLDIVGVVDFDRGEASIDASLIDSRLTVFALTGDMALRVGWGASKIFVIAAGGFHPRFQSPAGFPVLRRLTIALADSDNPRLRMETYLALTANTIQFGAALDAYFKMNTFVGTFSVAANITFDTLIQFQPFELIAELAASIDIERNETPILHAALKATFSGPKPWHAIGYAEFDFLGKRRIDFEATVGTPERPPIPELDPLEVLKEIAEAFSRADSWVALPPAEAERVVSLRDREPGATVLVHPLGSLSARQRVLPLGKSIDRFGASVVAPTTFALNGFRLTPDAATTAPAEGLYDDFAPGQFASLTDDERLARPAFESMRSGGRMAVASNPVPSDPSQGVSAEIGYEEWVVDVEPETGLRGETQPPGAKPAAIPGVVLASLVHGGAAASAETRVSGSAQFRGADVAVTVLEERYRVAGADTLAPVTGAPVESSAEAHDRLAKRSRTSPPAQVVPAREAA